MLTADIHTHILPNMDDGADNLDISAAMLNAEVEQGVRNIALTSHFDSAIEPITSFIQRRNASFEKMMYYINRYEFSKYLNLFPSAEIMYSPFLDKLSDLDLLCVLKTKVLLIEFPVSHCPEFVQDVFYHIQLSGFIPLIAHVERYLWVREKPELLYDFVSCGAYAQVNADSILDDKKSFSFFCRMYEKNLIHCIASDTHNMNKRPPRLQQAGRYISEKMGEEVVRKLNNTCECLFSGQIPDRDIPYKPQTKKSIFTLFRH